MLKNLKYRSRHISKDIVGQGKRTHDEVHFLTSPKE